MNFYNMTSIIKKSLFLLSLAMVFGVNAYSQCDSVNTELSDKFNFLGDWQSNGYPNYLEEENDTISEDIFNFINTALPETMNIVNSGYFQDDLKSNTELIDSTTLYLTFIQEGADWKNVLGFYSYDLDNPPQSYSDIDSFTVVFPFVDQNNLFDGGEKVNIGWYPANTGIGYFLMPKGWTGDTICLGKRIVFTDKELNTFTSEKYRQHTVLLNYEEGRRLLLGIEDQPRPSGDQDFNDAVFFISASNPDAIDTTDMPKVPIAIISGDTVLCDDTDVTTIDIDLKGTPPFNIVYNNGIEDIAVNNINEYSYSFETSVKGVFTLVSFEDADGVGIAKGEANVVLNSLDAGFVKNPVVICEDETEIGVEVYFEGYEPFSLTYVLNGEEITIEDISESKIAINVEAGSTLVLTEVSDLYCTEELSEELELIQEENPTASLEVLDVTACEGEVINVGVSLKGSFPLTFTYDINGVEKSVQVESSEYFIPVTEDAIISAVAVSSASCSGSVEGTATIDFNNKPTAELDKPEVQCGTDQEVDITLTFSGAGPFSYSYSLAGQEFEETTNGSKIISVGIDETFQLLSFEDELCSGNVIDSIHTFKNYATPTAEIITNQVKSCENTEAEILIELSGMPPFEFVITNGEVSETVTTSQFNYTYSTDQSGVFEIISIENENCVGTSSGTAEVSHGTAPTVSAQIPEVNCDAASSAIVTLVFEGVGPFNYAYELSGTTISESSDNTTVEIEVGLGESFELLSFSDTNCNGDVVDDEYLFYNYEPTTASIESGDLYLCEPTDEASIEILLSGTFPLTFVISNGTTTEVITTSNNNYTYNTSEPGTYEILSVTNGVCDGVPTGSSSVILYDEKPSVDFYASSNLICEGGTSSIIFEFSGEAPWSFTLINGNEMTDYNTSESVFEVEVSGAGIFQIENFTDAHCSTEVIESVEIGYYDKPSAVISGGGSYCGEETVEVSISLSGQAPFEVVYTDGEENISVSVNDNTYVFETSVSGTYSLVSVNDAHCTGETSGEAVVSNMTDEFEAEVTGPESICQEENISIVLTTDQDFNSISWTTTGTGQINNNGTASIEYIPGEGEVGKVDFEAIVTTDCGEIVFPYSVVIIETPNANFIISPEDLFSESEIVFEVEESGEGTYFWEFGDGNSATGDQTIHVYTQGGEYEVTLSIDNQGCKSSLSQGIIVKSLNELYVPNVFNPNAINAENRVVKVYGTNISEEGFSFKIVNRWGNTMYQTTSFNEANSVGWDGREHHIKEDQSLSTFTWVLSGHFNDGELFERTGTVTILQ